MTESRVQFRLVSYEQVKAIIGFMEQHVELASGNQRSIEARHTSKRLWEELSKILNNCRGGTRKTSDGWSKYWSDFKNKLKNKVYLLKKKKRNSSQEIKPLTKLEKRTLDLLGPFYFNKKRNRDSMDTNSILPDKIEFYQITNHVNNSDGDRLSDGGDQSNDSAESTEVSLNDYGSNSFSELKNIYPKWLIEIEKKRADAELIRAKAEEHRAVVAAKNAEASLLQAEALKRLADAARTQADAILRIAAVLELKGNRDLI